MLAVLTTLLLLLSLLLLLQLLHPLVLASTNQRSIIVLLQ
jgi:hypothetical protein